MSGHGTQRSSGRSSGGISPVDRRSAVTRLFILVVVVAAGAAIAVAVGLPGMAGLRGHVAAIGPAAPAVFVLLYAAATLLPLPKNVLSAVAGLVFGFAGGVALVLIAAVLGAIVAFLLGRCLGRDAVERFTGTRVERVDELLRRRGVLAVIGLRLVPMLPFTAVNYAAGLSAVRIRDYVIGTAVGIVPGTAAYVALGVYGTSPGQWPFVAAVAVLVAMTLSGVVVARRAHRDGTGARSAVPAR